MIVPKPNRAKSSTARFPKWLKISGMATKPTDALMAPSTVRDPVVNTRATKTSDVLMRPIRP